MIIGFTGSRRGMTSVQKKIVRQLLEAELENQRDVIGEHGDCIGADADFDEICADLGMVRWCRPCDMESYRAHTSARELAPPTSPKIRNLAIVADASKMIACPRSHPATSILGKASGTWNTIGYAKDARKPLVIIYPDGTLYSNQRAKGARRQDG